MYSSVALTQTGKVCCSWSTFAGLWKVGKVNVPKQLPTSAIFVPCVCVCKHLGARCWLFRTRLDENNDDRSFFDSWHFSLSGFEVSGIRESSRFRYYHFAGGQWISFHPLPNEDGGLRLWYLRGTPWRRTCKFELFELLTSCYNTVFPSKFRLQSDRFPTNFRHMSVWCPSNFRSFPLVSGRTFDQFPISFELHFDELWQLGLRLLPDDRLFRKKNIVCVNRGLWDNLSLPRTTPDKHVELSSVCVSPPGATSSRLDGPSEKVQVR